MGKRHPWPEIKAAYVEGVRLEDGTLHWPTLEEVARKFGASVSRTRQRSGAEGWPTERNLFRTRVEQLRREKKSEALAGKAAEFDADVLKAAEIGVKHIQGHFLTVHEAFAASGGKTPMDSLLLERLSRALERYQQIGRAALGDEPAQLLGPIVIRAYAGRGNGPVEGDDGGGNGPG